MAEGAHAGIYRSGPWEIDLPRRELRSNGVLVPLGGRAFDILEVLIRSSGQLVTKDELIAEVWPGAIVEENTLQVHVSAVRKALGRDRGLLRTSSGRGYRLAGDWVARDQRSRDVKEQEQVRPAAVSPATNLPAAMGELIGRALGEEQLRDLVSAYRVVTLTGHGGIGKTALALATARSLLSDYNGDVWLIDLASLSDPELVPSAVAGALGLRFGGEPILAASIARAIGQRRLLLLLDNCEHVIGAAAEFAETVVRFCPRASILATSREALRIEGEYAYRVPPLDVPSLHTDDAGHILQCSAVRFLIEKMKTLDSQFSPRDDDLTIIAAICQHLDGIPLALEFAAARAATIGLQQVAARLEDRFGLLIHGRRTARPRHQTLRAALDWSYDLLSEPEQRLLRRLAVFPAGFTLDAVSSIVPASRPDEPAVLDGIGNLVAKSMVMVEVGSDAGRWRLLETVRAYALEKLAETGETHIVARRHAEFVRDRIASVTLRARLQLSKAEIALLAGEMDNVRAALEWAFSLVGDPGIGAVLTAAYVPVWLNLGMLVECRDRVERVLGGHGVQIELTDAILMHLHLGLGISLFFTIGPMDRAKTVLTQALAAATRLDDLLGQLRALWVLWGLSLNSGECDAALSAAEQFADVARRSGDPAYMVYGDRLMGNALCYSGDQTKAGDALQRVLDAHSVPSERLDSIMIVYDLRLAARIMLARVLWLQGRCGEARDMASDCLKEAQAANHHFSIYEALRIAVCPIALATGDLAAAERYVAMMIDLATSSSSKFWVVLGTCFKAKLTVLWGELQAGATEMRIALEACKNSGWTICYPEYLGALAQALAGTGHQGDALAIVDEALARAESSGERWFASELLRLKGELLFREGGDSAAASAEMCFDAAIDLARQQGALFWQLRSGMSLARMKVAQGQLGAARNSLSPIYQRFAEGLDTPDLRAARALLESLPPSG